MLEDSPLGQFQQSSSWAWAKAEEGWNVARFVVVRGEASIGGFQILWKSKCGARLGYITKGPVSFISGLEGVWKDLAEAVIKAVRLLRLTALIVQPPDFSCEADEHLRSAGFVPEVLFDIINATLYYDLSGTESDLWNRMPGDNRKPIRQAQRREVRIREGAKDELEVFFQLMCETCARQRAKPNPSSVQILKRVWDGFHPRGGIRLTFAEVGGAPVASMISIRFGNRASGWKRGGRVDAGKSRANHLLLYESLCWAQRMGCGSYDICSLRLDIAEAKLSGEKFSQEQSSSRDMFLLGFGGVPQIIPGAWIFIPNPVLRCGYHSVSLLRRRFYGGRQRGILAPT